MTAVSVVIPTRGRPDLIGRSVRAVLSNTHDDFEVLVVDQSADDGTRKVVEAIARDDARLRYVHLLPPGLSRAYNAGARLARARLLAFTDDDCVARPDWIGAIASAFARDHDAELLYGVVAMPAELAGAAGEVPVLPIARAERLDHRNGFRIYGMGANFAMRRALLDRLGGFDEILGGGGPLRSSQDFDLQYRAYLARAVVLLRPDVVVEHYGLRSPAQWPATLYAYGFGNGAFYMKHVRCGDLRAAKMLASGTAHALARQVWHVFNRRSASHSLYLRSVAEGVLQSLRYPVDRPRRLYRPRAAA